jgi:hypothetical protein
VPTPKKQDSVAPHRRALDQLEAEELGAFAQRLEFTSAVELVVSGCSGVAIDEIAGEDAVLRFCPSIAGSRPDYFSKASIVVFWARQDTRWLTAHPALSLL